MEVEKITRVVQVHLQTLQAKLEDILVEVVFNGSKVFCFFSCAPSQDRLFG